MFSWLADVVDRIVRVLRPRRSSGLQFAGAFVDLLERIVQAGIDLDGECLEGGDTLNYWAEGSIS